MTDPRRHIIYSCIGPPMLGDSDPIYEVVFRFPPVEVHLVSSDEPPPKGREPTSVNIERIRDRVGIAKVPVHSDLKLDLLRFEDNSYQLATRLIRSYQDNPGMQLVVDLSAGRGSIRQALSRASEIAIDVIQQEEPDYYIQAVIRSRNQPVLDYKIGRTSVPEGKDIYLLLHIEERLTQTALARKLGWNNQSEVSKGVQRLEALGLVDNLGHKNRVLTDEGRRIRQLFRDIRSQ